MSAPAMSRRVFEFVNIGEVRAAMVMGIMDLWLYQCRCPSSQ